jgi:hypothetical protein
MAKTVSGAQQTGGIPPATRVTVQGELNRLFNLLVVTGGELDALEQTLDPVLHAGGAGEGSAGNAEPPQPDVISTIRGLIAGAESNNARLSNLRFRLALD